MKRRDAARWMWILGIAFAGCVVMTAYSGATAAMLTPEMERPAMPPCTTVTETPDASTALTIGTAAPPCGGRALPTPMPTPVPFPTGAATTTAIGGTREFVSTAAGFALRYPEAWNVGTQGSRTTTFSPETGETRVAGFLIEVYPDLGKTPDEDLRDALAMSTNPQFVVVTEPYAVEIDGIPALRADVRFTFSDTATTDTAASGSRRDTPPPPVAYDGSLLVFEYRGVNYRIGIFARDGDPETRAQAEEVLATLRFT